MRGLIAVLAIALVLAPGCTRRFLVDYPDDGAAMMAPGWRVVAVDVRVPDSLAVNDRDVLAPRGDIVWHAEGEGDKKAQVAQIVEDGIAQGAATLDGDRPVIIGVTLERFHATSPTASALAPSAVNRVIYRTQVFDAETLKPLTQQSLIRADKIALTRGDAIRASRSGDQERRRMVDHIAAVTRGWLGLSEEDPRGRFFAIGL